MFEEKNENIVNEVTEQGFDLELNQEEQALEVEDASLKTYGNAYEQATEFVEEGDLQEIILGYDEEFEDTYEQIDDVVQHEFDKPQGYPKLRGKTVEELENFYNSIGYERKVGVYVKTNAQGYIIDVKSDIFEKNLDGYVKIDEGDGDRYVHAQTCYFEEPLSDESGNYRYKL